MAIRLQSVLQTVKTVLFRVARVEKITGPWALIKYARFAKILTVFVDSPIDAVGC